MNYKKQNFLTLEFDYYFASHKTLTVIITTCYTQKRKNFLHKISRHLLHFLEKILMQCSISLICQCLSSINWIEIVHALLYNL